jgi:cobaltochelatase CobT
MMRGQAKKKHFSVNPEDMLKSLAGLTGPKRNTPVGSLPTIPWDPRAEPALKGFYDLRALALRFLDTEFVTAIRPASTEQAYMFDAGLDAMGYVAFASSEYAKYPGIQKNLQVLQGYLLETPHPEIMQYDLAAFLIVLRAARETLPELAATTLNLEPLLTEERIFQLSGKRPSEFSRVIRGLFNKRLQFAKFFHPLSELNEAVAAFFPLLQHEPDKTILDYRALMEKIRAVSKNAGAGAIKEPPLSNKQPGSRRKRSTSRKKRHANGEVPNLEYYLPVAAAVTDRVTRPDQFASWPIVPATIKDLYLQHARELTRTQRTWDQYAKETWPARSTMHWQIVDEGGSRPLHLAQTVIDPFGQPLEVKLIEKAQQERQTEAIFLFNLSVSMQEDERYLLSFMVADRFSELLTRGGIPTEIIGHTTTGEAIPRVTGRNRSMLYLLFKTREEPHNLLTIQRLCSVLDTQMHYLSYDGEAMMWTYERLKNSPAKHRLLFVVTDGDISGTYINKNNKELRNATTNYFRDVVARIEAEKFVDVIGVPIKADVDGIFSRSVRIDSIEDIYKKLSPYVLKMLREFNNDEGEAAKARRLRMVAHRKARVEGQGLT